MSVRHLTRIGCLRKVLGIWLICQVVNLLLVANECIRSRLDWMTLLIATRLVSLPRDSLRSMELTMRRHFPRWLAFPLFVLLLRFSLPASSHYFRWMWRMPFLMENSQRKSTCSSLLVSLNLQAFLTKCVAYVRHYMALSKLHEFRLPGSALTFFNMVFQLAYMIQLCSSDTQIMVLPFSC